MSKISYEDIGNVTATFFAEEGVAGGQVVKLNGSATVAPCGAGERFCGVALEPGRGCAAVQVKGFLTVQYSGALTPGWANLVADGSGGVKAGEDGVPALVISAEGSGSAVICL